MDLTVGLLTSNCEHLLPAQLDSLTGGLAGVPNWRLVVADSGSTDDTLAVAKQLAPTATVVELAGNPGFAAQCNAVAAAHPDSDAVLILSRTARLRPGCAAALLGALAADPSIGVTVPRLATGDTYGGPPGLRASLRRRPTLARAWGEALLGGRLTRSYPALTEVIPEPAGYTDRTPFDWATGGVTMFSRACQSALGGWDESFFLYSEETDYELRAADHGLRVVFVPQAGATHVGGDSQIRPEFWAHLRANRVRLYGMRHGPAAAWSFWAATAVGELLRLGSRPVTRRAALAKLWREGPALVAGRPALRPPGY
jgi:N-acetylglucosaminyl-diphospho-decaprenol L-rhamnosyltransferase